MINLKVNNDFISEYSEILDLFNVECVDYDTLRAEPMKIYEDMDENEKNRILEYNKQVEYELDDFSSSLTNTGSYSIYTGRTKKSIIRPLTHTIPKFNRLVLENKNNTFVTCIDDIKREGIAPERIPVIMKSMSKQSAINEILSSRILNFYGCNTCFNFLIQNYKNNHNKSKSHDFACGSVDFISQKNKFYTFHELEFYFNDDIELIFKLLEYPFETIDHERLPDIKDKGELEKIKRDIVRSSIVRKVLLSDSDYDNRNTGLLFNPETNKYSYVDFDYELTLTYSNVIHRERNKELLKFAYMNYRDIYDDILEKTKYIYEAYYAGLINPNHIPDECIDPAIMLKKNIELYFKQNKEIQEECENQK